jgi:hypothetical protein
MTTLLEIREDIKNIYGRFSAFILPAVKFLLALTALLMINSSIGYNKTLAGMIPSLILALLSALMPVNAICAVMAVVILRPPLFPVDRCIRNGSGAFSSDVPSVLPFFAE